MLTAHAKPGLTGEQLARLFTHRLNLSTRDTIRRGAVFNGTRYDADFAQRSILLLDTLRQRGNRYLLLGIGAVAILQLFTYAPPLQRLIDTEVVPLHVWPWLFAGGIVFFVVVEMKKLIIRSSPSLRDAVTTVEAGA